jgi:hypothetical protein
MDLLRASSIFLNLLPMVPARGERSGIKIKISFGGKSRMISQFWLTLAQFGWPTGKAAEGRRSPRRCRAGQQPASTRSVLECSSPLELCRVNQGCLCQYELP